MNTNKRILSVVMCIAMILSMFSSFAFAAGSGDVASVTDEYTGVVDNTGAKPTTDVKLTVDANVYVVDSAASADAAYVLTWEGIEYADLTFTYGTNLFTKLADAQSVLPVGATVLVKSVADTGKVNFTVAAKYYTEAYNTMPFVVGTAFDGSDWSANADYTAKTETIKGFNVVITDTAKSGEFGLYGFTVSYGSYAIDANSTTVPVNITIQNTCYVPTSGAQYWFSMNTFATKEAAITSNILIKNFYVSASCSRFMSETVPNNFTFDGLYIPANIDVGGEPYLKVATNKGVSKLTFKNWNIQNEDLNVFFQGCNQKNWWCHSDDSAISGATSNDDFRTIEISNCTFNNSALYTMTSRFAYIYANCYSGHDIFNNRIINTVSTKPLLLNNSTTYANYLSLDMHDNYITGFTSTTGMASSVGDGGSNANGIHLYDNYLATTAGAQGGDYFITSTNATCDWHSTDYYLDANMSIKASDLAKGITVNGGMLVQDGLNLNAYIPAGTGTENVVLPENTTAQYDLANGKVTITKVINEVSYSVTYTLKVTELTAPAFTAAYDDPADMIDASKALLITNAFKSAANGSVVETTWADETVYSFVKGVNLFDTIETASAYTLSKGILDAHYLVLDINGTKGASAPSQQFTMPGKYFTRNYNKNPYTKSDKTLDPYGLEWKSNIDTDNADSFVIANGISIKYFNVTKMAKAGDVEFYGFRITYTIEMNNSSAGTRSKDSDINLKFVNTYADIAGSELIYRDTTLSSPEVAEEYNDSLTFENFYYNPSTNANIYRTDAWPVRNVTFDGMFIDEGGASLANTYLHTYTSDYSFTIKNSNIRNVTMPLYLRGHYDKSADTKLNRSLEFTNNIFYNSTLGYNGCFLAVYTGYYNKFTFVNNTIFATQDNTVLRNASHGGGDTHPDITVTVKNNVLNGFANSFDIARWITPSASEVGYNWVSPVRETDTKLSGVTYTMTNSSTQKEAGYEYSADYYVDSGLKMLASEYMSKFDFVMAGGGAYKNGTTLDVYISTGKSAADLSLRDANASVVGWKDANGNAVDATTITNANDGSAYTVTVGYPIDGHVYTVDFTVNVHANVVTGYAASTYENRVPTHPSEKTELVDIPHFPTGFVDEAGLINPNNAAFIDSDSAYGSTKYTISTGDYKVITWNGVQYLTVMNTSLFNSPENAYSKLTSKGVEHPEYLIAGAEWGVQQGGYYSGTESNYTIRRPGKYFMPSYANKPYIKGDGKGNGWVSNIGTGEGQFNPDNAIKVGYLHIDDTSYAGDYELYGYTVASTINDTRKTSTNEIHLTFYNSYFEGTGAVYDSIYKYSNASVLSNAANHDSVTFKDTYFVVSGGRSFLRYPATAELVFDGVFADFTQQTYSGTRYFNQVNNNYKFEIRNSFYTGNTTAKTYIEGYNGTAYAKNVAEGNKQLILENNIFKNYSFCGNDYFIIMKHQYFTEVTIKGNYIDNSGKSMYLFDDDNLDSNGGVDKQSKYTITENTFIGFNGNLSNSATIGRKLAEGSVIAKNYTSEDKAVIGVQLKNNTLTGDYYLDPAREILASEYKLVSWTADKAYIEIDRDNKAITYKATKGGIFTDANLVLGSDKVEAKFYTDNTLTEEIADITTHIDDAYLVLYFENSEGFVVDYEVYSVDFEYISDKFFKDVYVVPETDDIKTTIDKDKVIIVDYASNDVAEGTIFTTTWKGTEYDFIKGVNAFATIYELNDYLDTANIEYPHVLLKTVTDGTYKESAGGKKDFRDIEAYGAKAEREIIIKHHGAYYTENYNIKPYVVTDGVWAKNPEFKHENGIVGRWVKADPKLGNGLFEVYGFSTISAFQVFSESGEGRTDEIPSMYVENGYVIGDDVVIDPSSAPAHGHNDYTWKKDNAAAGEIYLKNVYADGSITGKSLLYPGSLPAKVTYDGVFVDGGDYAYKTEGDMNIYVSAFELNIINCYIKDSYANINIRDRATENAEEKDFSITITGTTFENAGFGGEALIKFNDGVSAFTFENNTVKNSKVIDLIAYTDTDMHNNTLDLTIKNNLLAGINGAVNAGDNVNIVEISGNNFAGAWNEDGTEVGDQLTVAGTDYANVDYWLVYDGENFSKISNVAYEMTFSYADNTYTSAQDVELDVFLDEGYINLCDYISEEQYNKIAVYSAADTDRVDPLNPEKIKVTSAIDLVVVYTSHDGTSEEQTWNINLSVAGNEIEVNNKRAPGQAVPESKKYRLSWKSTVTGSIEASFIPSGEIVNHRVGAIYAVSNNSGEEAEAKALLESYVAQLNEGTKTTEDFDAVLADATYTTNVRVYALEDKVARWDSDSASYCYYYNVTVKPEKTRTVMMYAIYYNVEAAEYQVVYSDFVEQTAPQVNAAE